jgi:hypothetical protein
MVRERVLLSSSLLRKFCIKYSLDIDNYLLHVNHPKEIYTSLEFICRKHDQHVASFKIIHADLEKAKDDELVNISVRANRKVGLCKCLHKCKNFF